MDKLKSVINQKLSPKRFQHSLGVAETAVKLAEQNGLSKEKAYLAGLVHDFAREMPHPDLLALAEKNGEKDPYILASPELLHAPVGAYLARIELGIEDWDVLEAISSHTLGRRKMGRLEQIIYLADMIEPNRNYPGVEKLRERAKIDLTNGITAALEHTIRYLLDENKPIHVRTVEARNYLITEGKFF